MLKARVIPTLLWKNFGLVKGIGFDSWRRIGSVLPAIKVYNQREVDELVLLDIIAHLSNEDPDYDSIKDFGEECFVPFTIGGGIRNLDQVRRLLRLGADKVAMNTVSYDHPNLVTEIATVFGTQCIVASVDVRQVDHNKWICYSHAGQNKTNKEVKDWCKELEDRGAGEILLTSIDRDGTMLGYDISLIEKVSSSVNIPVVASGGAGNYQDMVDAIKLGGASAVAAASIFHFTELTPAGAKAAMEDAGIPIRRSYSPVTS